MDTNTPVSQMPSQEDPSPMQSPTPSSGGDASHSSKIMLIIVLIVVLILLAFGTYMFTGVWMGGENEEAAFQAQQANDSVASIEDDLKATDVNNLDKELGDIGTALNEPTQ
jgi:flagellar basal body-associated protein FliL